MLQLHAALTTFVLNMMQRRHVPRTIFMQNTRTSSTDFAPSILKKRQAELQELLDKNIVFKKEADRLIEQAEKQAYAPVHAKLRKTIAKMAQESGYAFVLNADNNALPYVNNMIGEDITVALKTALQ